MTLVTLGDFAKYSMTQSIKRSHCDSRASCLQYFGTEFIQQLLQGK